MGKYEEALERAKQGMPIDEVFPELKESEDERIRKMILDLVSISGNGNQWEEINAWLEKQKEQKPTDSEEIFESVDNAFRRGREVGFREGVESVKTVECSEEDRKNIADFLYELNVGFTQAAAKDRAKDILSIIRPQPHWKPSEEQMRVLNKVVNGDVLLTTQHKNLESLYNDLKSL